jgi:protein tyrosine phosphatase (PTP) superfamily phosphohydrolase (DUF442 family)
MKDTTAKIAGIDNFRTVDAMLATSGQPTEDQLRAAAAEGYEVVINLALHNHPRYSLPDEAGLVESLGMTYVHIPVQFDAPGENELLAFFEAMDAHKDRKRHIHCSLNKRATVFLGLYNMIRLGQAEADAFETMRSVWEPDEVWAAFIADMQARHVAHSPAR